MNFAKKRRDFPPRLHVVHPNNNIVTLDYVITSGPDSNNASFNSNALQDTLSDGTNTYPNTSTGGGTAVTTITQSSGGTAQETNESVRFNAPLAFATQNRAVTSDDYATIIKNGINRIRLLSLFKKIFSIAGSSK